MMLNLCGVPMGVEEEDGSLPYEGVTFDILQRFHAYLKHVLVPSSVSRKLSGVFRPPDHETKEQEMQVFP